MFSMPKTAVAELISILYNRKESAMNAPSPTGRPDLFVTDGIARITFNGRSARNALTFAMYEQMAAICETYHGTARSRR